MRPRLGSDLCRASWHRVRTALASASSRPRTPGPNQAVVVDVFSVPSGMSEAVDANMISSEAETALRHVQKRVAVGGVLMTRACR